jgi:uncharacterized protein (DUF2342 family)
VLIVLEYPLGKGIRMNRPLELPEITGLALTTIGVLIENYVNEGYADPTMYKALRASAELAEHFKARMEIDGAPDAFVESVGELITNLQLTAMECGEVVERIIKENGWEEEGKNWSDPHANCDHDHENGED